jgi:hypothetical protein
VTTVKSTVVGTSNYEGTVQSQLDPTIATIVLLLDVPAAAQDMSLDLTKLAAAGSDYKIRKYFHGRICQQLGTTRGAGCQSQAPFEMDPLQYVRVYHTH